MHKLSYSSMFALLCFSITSLILFNFNSIIVILVAVLGTLSLLEFYTHSFSSDFNIRKLRLNTNYALAFINLIITGSYSFILSEFVTSNDIGLLSAVGISSGIIKLVISILILDLGSYALHFSKHRFRILWRFHAVHHSDLEFDTSSFGRDHPVISLVLCLQRSLIIVVFGITPHALFIYIILINIFIPLAHANVYIPHKFDSLMRAVFVTPRMHYVHHSTDLSESHSNLGSVFSFWDRIFGTYIEKPQDGIENMKRGLAQIRKPEEILLKNSIIQPFKKDFPL